LPRTVFWPYLRQRWPSGGGRSGVAFPPPPPPPRVRRKEEEGELVLVLVLSLAVPKRQEMARAAAGARGGARVTTVLVGPEKPTTNL